VASIAGLDGRKISPHRDSIPGPSSPQSVAIPTDLPGPHIREEHFIIFKIVNSFALIKFKISHRANIQSYS
jgi:hypothetical protein